MGNVNAVIKIAIALALILAIYFFWSNRPVSYAISSFEPITVYNHTGNNGYINNPQPAVIVSVLAYYGETFTEDQLKKINDDFFDPTAEEEYTSTVMQAYVREKFGYEAERISVNPAILKEHIVERKIPVMTFMPMPGHPGDFPVYGLFLIVGINEKNKTLTYHDFYGGYGQTISFDEYRSKNRNLSLVIYPKNADYQYKPPAAARFLQPSDTMKKAVPLINNITFTQFAFNEDNKTGGYKTFFPLALETIEHPDFALVPPYYKVKAYAYAALGYWRDKKYKKAENMNAAAQILNKDLDKPFSDYWPGFEDRTNLEAGVHPTPYYIDGLILNRKKMYPEAIQSLQRSLQIWPYASAARNLLEKVKASSR